MRSFFFHEYSFYALLHVVKDVLEISERRITELNQKCEIGQCAENKSKKTIKCMIHIQKQWKRFKLIKKDDWRQTSSRPCTLISAWVLKEGCFESNWSAWQTFRRVGIYRNPEAKCDHRHNVSLITSKYLCNYALCTVSSHHFKLWYRLTLYKVNGLLSIWFSIKIPKVN